MNSRKLFLMWMAFIGMMTIGTAQAQVALQVRAGVGMSKLQGLSLMENRLSYKVGLAVDIPVSGPWAVQPALYFVQKGTNFKGNYGNEQIVPVTLDNRLSYFELPVYAAFKIDLGSESQVALKAGPYVAWGIVGKAHVSSDDMDFHRTFVGELFTDGCTYDGLTLLSTKSGAVYKAGSKAYKNLDAGVAFGADFKYQHFLVGVDCSWGLLPACEGVFDNVALEGDLKNLAVHLTLGYQF